MGIIYFFCSRRQDCEVKKSSSKTSSASFNDCIVVLGCKWVLYTSFPYSSIWKTLRTSGVASNKVKAPELPWKNLQMQKKMCHSLFRDFLSVDWKDIRESLEWTIDRSIQFVHVLPCFLNVFFLGIREYAYCYLLTTRRIYMSACWPISKQPIVMEI